MLKSNLDYLGIPCSEICSMDSAILAGTAVGVFDSVESACARSAFMDKIHLPGDTDYSECYQRFCDLTSTQQ